MLEAKMFATNFIAVSTITGGLEKVGPDQGNLKEESVVAAILPSRMEVSYRTSRFFRS